MLRSPSAAIKPPCRALQSHPSDLELVDSYLRTWVETGVKRTGGFIHDADVYAADPADLTRRFAPAVAGDGDRVWYFYTPLRHKSVHGKRKTRTVATGGGCWHNEAKSKPLNMVSSDGAARRQIGHRQSFSFVKKETGVRVRTGWLMVELRLLKEGAAQKPEAEESALGNRVLCKVYRSPRNPEPSSSGATAAAAEAAEPGHKAEAEDDESSDATLDDNDDVVDDDDSSGASLAAAPGPKNEVESSEATVAAPSRHSKADDETSGGEDAAAPGRKEKAEVDEDSVETSAAAPPRKRKALDDETSGAAGVLPARKKSGGGAPVSTTEMQCPQCGTHLVVTVKKAEPKSETEIAKEESTTGAPLRGETRASSQKSVRFLEFL